jgi:hypothetical protein
LLPCTTEVASGQKVVYSVRVSVTTPAMAPAAPRVRAAIEKRIVMELIE